MDSKENILSDLEARKRDHKVYITDEAIAKVPFIRYKEIPEEHYLNIYELMCSMKINKEKIMFERDILSERLEDQLEAVKWAKEMHERFRRSDEATKQLKEECTALFLENIRKARAGKVG